MNAPASGVFHNVHGLLTVRLIGSGEAERARLAAVLGPSQGDPTGEPDVSVRFVKEIRVAGRLTLLGKASAAFDEDGFYVLDARGRKTRLPLDRIGEPCEIVCERGVEIPPLLVPILAIRLLARAHVLVHAASFVYRGCGVLVAAWEGGGKSETLLPFMLRGAHYVADEWTIVSGGPEPRMYGLSGDVQVWSWQLRQLDELWSRIGRRERNRLRGIRALRAVLGVTPNARALPFRALRQVSAAFDNVARVSRSPVTLFGDRLWRGEAPLDRAFLATVVNGPTVVRPADPDETAARVASTLVFERRGLTDAYRQFRFAFPARRNRLLETADAREVELLRDGFRRRPTYLLEHPKPVRLGELADAAGPYCE